MAAFRVRRRSPRFEAPNMATKHDVVHVSRTGDFILLSLYPSVFLLYSVIIIVSLSHVYHIYSIFLFFPSIPYFPFDLLTYPWPSVCGLKDVATEESTTKLHAEKPSNAYSNPPTVFRRSGIRPSICRIVGATC